MARCASPAQTCWDFTVPAWRVPGGLDAPGCLFTYAGSQHCGGQMPESPQRGQRPPSGTPPAQQPQRRSWWACSGPIRGSWVVTWYSRGGWGLFSEVGRPCVGSSSQPGASALCPTDCWVSAHRLPLAALHVSSGLSFPSRAHTIPRGRTSTPPSLGCVLSCTTAAGPGVGVPGPP